MTYIRIICSTALLLLSLPVFGQEILGRQEAVILTLDNNYGIKIAENEVKAADNNASILNSGYLPSLSSAVNGTYNEADINVQFRDGNTNTLNGAESSRYSASVDLDYVLFDGLGRMYNYRLLNETYNLSKLEARSTIENTLLVLFENYYEVARLSQNLNNTRTSLEISENQLTRSRYQFEYGQANQLDVLNAEVNVNNDSIAVLTIQQELANSKRNLNLILGRPITTEFEVDTSVNFLPPFTLEEMKESALANNVQLLMANKGLEISNFNVKVNQSNYVPRIVANGSYGWNKNNNNQASFLLTSRSVGFTGGVTLSWDIFDGGSSINRVRNAKIEKENLEIQKQQLLQQLERDLVNAYTDYQNKLYILMAQEKNVETNKRNFNRSEERFKVGQIASIDYRLAQQNLLNAVNNRNQAQYEAKLAELYVMQIAGRLMDQQF